MILKLIICFIFALTISCVSSTFESPMVYKGNQGWVGFAVGRRCFDYSIPDDYSYTNSEGGVLCAGYSYGFTDNIAFSIGSAFYVVKSDPYYTDVGRLIYCYPTIYLAPKFEITRSKSDVALSVMCGGAYPEMVKTRIMIGSKGAKNQILNFGTNLSFWYPYDFFINLGPAEGSGIIVYLGYQIPYFNNPMNLAMGLGYRFR